MGLLTYSRLSTTIRTGRPCAASTVSQSSLTDVARLVRKETVVDASPIVCRIRSLVGSAANDSTTGHRAVEQQAFSNVISTDWEASAQNVITPPTTKAKPMKMANG